MEIKENYNLSKLNTFGISVNAKLFVEVKSEADLEELFSLPEFKENEKIFLGGGSNVLFLKDFDGLVILNKLKGIEIVSEDDKSVSIRAMGGELWHDLVIFAVERGLWGIENLSLIPGTVGAAPMQNIGAYGAELASVLANVEAYEISAGKENKKKIFTKEECGFGYRDSVFKNKFKGKYFISATTLKLRKSEMKNTNYKSLREYLEKNNVEIKSSKDVSEAVAFIRRGIFPDPKITGNAGSFFKAVFVDKEKLSELSANYPAMPHFEEDGAWKIPAGWLVEQTGWKGKSDRNVGVYGKHALILVNHGGATGEEIKNLAEQIIVSVKDKFGLELIPEVNFISQ